MLVLTHQEERLIQFLHENFVQPSRVLDFGCGFPKLLFYLREKFQVLKGIGIEKGGINLNSEGYSNL